MIIKQGSIDGADALDDRQIMPIQVGLVADFLHQHSRLGGRMHEQLANGGLAQRSICRRGDKERAIGGASPDLTR